MKVKAKPCEWEQERFEPTEGSYPRQYGKCKYIPEESAHIPTIIF
jgi:hypothetical protein